MSAEPARAVRCTLLLVGPGLCAAGSFFAARIGQLELGQALFRGASSLSGPSSSRLLAVGGYEAIERDTDEFGRVERLSAFAFVELTDRCKASNSLSCAQIQGAALGSVESATVEVVSGKNYRIERSTTVGTLRLSFYEQLWTSTLLLTEAALVTPGVSLDFIHDELALDAAAFEAFLAQGPPVPSDASAEEPVCTSGRVWSECGSPCTATCADPWPICAAVCVSRCECPRDLPLWEDGGCVDASLCPAADVLPCVPQEVARCTREYNPVCSDGTTYSNPCLADAACAVDITPGPCSGSMSHSSKAVAGSVDATAATLPAPSPPLPSLSGDHESPQTLPTAPSVTLSPWQLSSPLPSRCWRSSSRADPGALSSRYPLCGRALERSDPMRRRLQTLAVGSARPRPRRLRARSFEGWPRSKTLRRTLLSIHALDRVQRVPCRSAM